MTALISLAADIRREHEAAFAKAREALEHARRAGELLIDAKAHVGHGNWLAWIAEHCGFSARTAQGYMRLASRWPELEAKCATVAHLPLREALAAIAEPAAESPAECSIDDFNHVFDTAKALGLFDRGWRFAYLTDRYPVETTLRVLAGIANGGQVQAYFMRTLLELQESIAAVYPAFAEHMISMVERVATDDAEMDDEQREKVLTDARAELQSVQVDFSAKYPAPALHQVPTAEEFADELVRIAVGEPSASEGEAAPPTAMPNPYRAVQSTDPVLRSNCAFLAELWDIAPGFKISANGMGIEPPADLTFAQWTAGLRLLASRCPDDSMPRRVARWRP